MAIDNILFVRVSVGDGKVCGDCIMLEALPPATLDWWETSGQMPRVAMTACDQKCRCGLVPDAIEDMGKRVLDMIEEAVKQGTQQTMIDLTTGRTIRLKDFENIQGLRTVQYERIAHMESLIYQWKVANGGIKLPDEFFKLQDIEKMIQWLEGGTLKTPLVPLTKEDIIERLKNAGVKTIYLDKLDDIKSLEDIALQIEQLSNQYGPIPTVRAWNLKGAYTSFHLGGINVDAALFNNYNKLIASMMDDIKSGFHPGRILPDNAARSTITHEYAHSLTVKEIMQKNGLYKEFSSIRSGYRRQLREMKETLNQKIYEIKSEAELNAYVQIWKEERAKIYISEYASRNIHEFVAEAFTDYKHSQNPSPYSIEVGKLIDAKYKKGGS